MAEPESFLDGRVVLHCGDSREVLRTLADGSIHAVVCDPPYALESIRKRFGGAGAAPAQQGRDGLYARASAGFMGQTWDTGETAFDPAFWAEVLRVLKPGGHVVAFGGTRTFHRLACAIEDAGFEIRDTVLELASLDPIIGAFVASLDNAQLSAFLRVMDLLGLEGVLAWVYGSGFPKGIPLGKHVDSALGAHWFDETERERGEVSHAHAHFDGFDVALKPAWEPIVLGRKPLAGTVAETVLAHGTGPLNIDGCRVVPDGPRPSREPRADAVIDVNKTIFGPGLGGSRAAEDTMTGRWPANVVHDGSHDATALFPTTARGDFPACMGRIGYSGQAKAGERDPRKTDAGSAARYFYSAKATAADRAGSKHPTVKPVDLMQWLCRLVTPPGGVVLDPFAGTGTTGEAAWREGFLAVLIEREPTYQADIRRRLALCLSGPTERKHAQARAKAHQAAPLPLFGGGDAAE